MAHDLVIRGGTLVDGLGNAPFTGDLAIDGGTISSVGGRAGPGKREIDAAGLEVTPGFIDLHTHLDAQVGWDPLLAPVSWHGVTTALMGNCAVTFAPCRPADRGTLAGMMETVENIPREAILSGLPWDWESYGGYLDSIEKLNPAINLAGMVGHSAVRFYVMGERAVEELATEDEKRQIAALVARSVDEGAVGFSANRLPGHVLPDGRSIPGTFADHDEFMHIARALRPRDALMQNVMEFKRADLDNATLLRRIGEESGGRVLVSYNAGASDRAGQHARDFFDRINQGGLDINALALPRSTGFVFGLQSSVPSYNIWGQTNFFGPSWEALAKMDFEGRVRAISDATFCAQLVDEARNDARTGGARDETKLPWIEQSYWMGEGVVPQYNHPEQRSLRQHAEAANEHWSEAFLRLSRQTNGRGLFTWRIFSPNAKAIGDWLTYDRVVPGLSDAGAHVSQVMDCGVTTYVLAHWVKDRGLYSLEEGVRRLTTAPARIAGIRDRGALVPGMRADVNVFELAKLGEGQPYLVHDFPYGAPRYLQRSAGYHATVVNGEITLRNGEHTGARPGKVLRHRASVGASPTLA